METTTADEATPTNPRASFARQMLNKVPEVTLYFWVIKILCTTVGETVADYLNDNLGFGLTNTSYVMSALLIAVLVWQFRKREYVPGVYWLAVVLISVVGTLISDNLVDNLGVALETTTVAFSILLAITFSAWYASEKTLSIHSIVTTRRESFYWLAILFTFALGTSAGDLVSERAGLGYGISVVIFAAAIALVALAHYRFKLGAVLAFWIAYILTRPLGASIGDLMSQKPKHGGLGLGTTGTSAIFLATILGLVVFLTITRRDRIDTSDDPPVRGEPAMADA
ncbi:membrane protein [soil metagenome]